MKEGWYTDPGDEQKMRYWDGEYWTSELEIDLVQPTKVEASKDASADSYQPHLRPVTDFKIADSSPKRQYLILGALVVVLGVLLKFVFFSSSSDQAGLFDAASGSGKVTTAAPTEGSTSTSTTTTPPDRAPESSQKLLKSTIGLPTELYVVPEDTKLAGLEVNVWSKPPTDQYPGSTTVTWGFSFYQKGTSALALEEVSARLVSAGLQLQDAATSVTMGNWDGNAGLAGMKVTFSDTKHEYVGKVSVFTYDLPEGGAFVVVRTATGTATGPYLEKPTVGTVTDWASKIPAPPSASLIGTSVQPRLDGTAPYAFLHDRSLTFNIPSSSYDSALTHVRGKLVKSYFDKDSYKETGTDDMFIATFTVEGLPGSITASRAPVGSTSSMMVMSLVDDKVVGQKK
jgi:hypothetical protein